MTLSVDELTQKVSDKASKVFDSFFKMLDKMKYIIIIFWILVTLGLLYCVFGFLKHTSMTVTAPKGTLGYEANALFKTYFPDQATLSDGGIVIQQYEKKDDINNSSYLLDFSLYLNDSLINDKKGYLVKKIQGRYISPPEDTIFQTLINKYSGINMVSGDTTLIELQLDSSEPSALTGIIKRTRLYIDDYIKDNGDNGYHFYVTGYDALSLDLQNDVIKSLEKMEFIVMPLALLILLYVVQSPVLLTIPLINMVVIIVVSFGIMYPISLNVVVFGITPAMMLSVIMACGIDYSLFLLTRFTEEINKKQSYYTSVSNMLRSSGRIVATSGCVMLCCFSVIAFFPFDLIRYMGIGCALAVTSTLLVDLTLSPALLLAFPRFFKLQSCVPCSKKCVKYTQKRARFQGFGDKMWHLFATFQSKKPVSLALLIGGFLILLPFCCFIYKFKWTLDTNQVVPIDTEFDIGFKTIQKAFPPGVLYPMNLLIQNNSQKLNYNSEEFYRFSTELVNTLVVDMNYAFDNNSYIAFNSAGAKVASPELLSQMEHMAGYVEFTQDYISSDNNLIVSRLISTVDPTNNSTQLVADIRAHLTQLESKYGYTLLLQSLTIDGVDCVNMSMRYFGVVVIALFIVILLLVLLFFKSLMVPVRVVLTTSLTVLFVFGSASFVFCTDYFDFIPDVKAIDGLYWGVPLVCLPIICGLSLDYDIFLFSRIKEYRERKFSTTVATVFGVERTGYLITFCGIIMAIAFSGLFMSDILCLKLFGFILTLSVLVDTFIVRTLIVPSFVHLFGEANWWPIKYEIEVTRYEDACDHNMYDHLDEESSSSSSSTREEF
ncbi:hypothetical protein EIN_057570, partial [Entamoeba invadens IP1]|uniref:hypothetical protein n=1 Tax=Entamoeba invadens IP1 TaxID=370355 RepID=UPI0002C3D44B